MTGDDRKHVGEESEPRAWGDAVPTDFWEERYAASDRVWSGRANLVLTEVAAPLRPGRALDLGCGEGGDVVWLARHGWDALGVDISATAVARAADAARAAGVGDEASETPGQGGRARFLVGDLRELPAGPFDLVTASFLHSPAALPREEILRRGAAVLAPGGHLLVTSHATPPPWAASHGAHHHERSFPTPDEEYALLSLDDGEWVRELAEIREREATGPNGERARLRDGVLLIRRRP